MVVEELVVPKAMPGDDDGLVRNEETEDEDEEEEEGRGVRFKSDD